MKTEQKITIIVTNLEAVKVNKKRRCTQCKSYKVQTKGITCSIGFFCDNDCRVDYANKSTGKLLEKSRAIKTKADNKAHSDRKKAFNNNDKKLRLNEAQKAFNKYIRLRDAKEPCISCQRHHSGQYHAGHYKTVGARSDLRFHEDNCHKQCAPCNNHLSGNIGEYIGNLINKIGQKRFDALTLVRKVEYTCEDLKGIELIYKDKSARLIKLNNGV